MISKYDDDKLLEERFARWLDDNFYDELAKRELIVGWYRVNGEKLQKEGKDTIIITNAGNEVIIDEKATLHYINKNIPTFAFELKNQSSGEIGWLVNKELKTEYYLLAWPNGNEPISSSKDFLYSDIMIISKNDVLKVLSENKIDLDNVEKFIAENMKNISKEHNKFELCPGISFNVNFSLAERPVNLVIRKDMLFEKAIFHYTVGLPKCDKCGAIMQIKEGPYGQFYGCPQFPKCKNIKNCTFEPFINIKTLDI